MQYYTLTLAEYEGLPRDKENRKYLSTDKFKTESKYGLDTVIFPPEVEQRIDTYIKYFRPILARETRAPGDALFLTRMGQNHVRIGTDVQNIFQKVCASTSSLNCVFH